MRAEVRKLVRGCITHDLVDGIRKGDLWSRFTAMACRMTRTFIYSSHHSDVQGCSGAKRTAQPSDTSWPGGRRRRGSTSELNTRFLGRKEFRGPRICLLLLLDPLGAVPRDRDCAGDFAWQLAARRALSMVFPQPAIAASDFHPSSLPFPTVFVEKCVADRT